ncbi:MAG: metal-dependent hydrolase [Thermoanaerobaculia bacterium]
MFIGHNAVGFGSKAAAPRVSLGLLMAAPMLLDLLWPIFVLLGLERFVIEQAAPTPFLHFRFTSYPWSHSLLMSCVWGALYGGGYYLRTRFARGGWILALGVVSHWVLDFVTHRPDLPLWPGGPKVGLGLWYSTAGTVIVESLLFVIGVAIYLRTTRARDRAGRIGPWTLIVFLAVVYAGSIFGGAPPSVNDVATVTLLTWLIPFWAAWLDQHRDVVA